MNLWSAALHVLGTHYVLCSELMGGSAEYLLFFYSRERHQILTRKRRVIGLHFGVLY